MSASELLVHRPVGRSVAMKTVPGSLTRSSSHHAHNGPARVMPGPVRRQRTHGHWRGETIVT